MRIPGQIIASLALVLAISAHYSRASAQDDRFLERELESSLELHEQERQLLRQVFEQERVDTDWAEQFEAKINDLAADDDFPGTRLLEVSCRTSICEILLEHRGVDAQNAFIDVFPFRAPPTAEAWFETAHIEDDSYRTRTFVVRPCYHILRREIPSAAGKKE